LSPLTYALLAQDAYAAIPQIGEEDSSARAILEYTDDGVAFAFPGTNNLACWLADLDCGIVRVDGLGVIHEGFWNAFSLIKDKLIAASKSCKPVATVCCGHSEGAALALLFAGQLCLEGIPPVAVYGFEPPRVTTDDTLAALLKANGVQIYLTECGNDVVPLVPRVFYDWQHPAVPARIGAASFPFPNVDDHSISRVIQALKGL